jgi:hypothetical protein
MYQSLGSDGSTLQQAGKSIQAPSKTTFAGVYQC